MAEEKPAIHIDTDWKKQAQEEKRRLADQEKAKAASSTSVSAGLETAPAGGPQGAAPDATSRPPREMPPASFAGIVSSLMTQALFYLGDLAPRGGEPVVNLDMAKQNIDTLAVLEEKTKGNLTEEEKRLLDAALYDVRMRYVSVASQYIT